MSSNRYKLLMVDIDCTLVGKDKTISVKDREALARARELDVTVSLSTGRVAQACSGIISQLSLDGYHIFFDGAVVSDPAGNRELYAEPIPGELAGEIVEFAHLNKIDLELYSVRRYFVERETWATYIRHHFFGIEPVIVDFAQLWNKERIIKGTLTVRSAEERGKADAFYRHFGSRLNFSRTKSPAYPEVDFVNVLAPTVSKGRALETLASFLGIPLSEVMAIGDGDNDISLLSSAGLAVAMDNALDELKAIADFVTLDVGHSGVAAAIERFLL